MSDTNKFNVPSFDITPSSGKTPNTTIEQPGVDEPGVHIPETITVGVEKKQISDPNSIHVEISAKNLPVILLFGPRSGGKTMVLVRLTRFLRKQGYSIEPVRDFRPSDSDEYEAVCNNFRRNINSQRAAASTHNMDFLLVKVSKNGRPICQFLEAPGEHYFREAFPDEPFPAYIHALLNLNMPRTWVFFLEKDWKNQGVKRDYADKIASMINLLNNRDRIILLHPKADRYPDLYDRGIPQTELFFNNIREDYEAIFNRLGKPSLFNFFRDSNRKYDFVVFSSGVFSGDPEESLQTFTESNDMYPAKLWDTILRSLRN